MTDKTHTAEEITETKLDELSGGPHFRNFHGVAFDFQSGVDPVETESGHYTQAMWDKTRY